MYPWALHSDQTQLALEPQLHRAGVWDLLRRRQEEVAGVSSDSRGVGGIISRGDVARLRGTVCELRNPQFRNGGKMG